MSAWKRLAAVARIAVLLGVALGSTGCARLFSSYDVAPNGLSRRDDTLRRLLVAGRVDSAVAQVEPKGESAPDDDLLRALYSGILRHYAGEYAASSSDLERAAELAEDRYTKRISRAALSLITSDRVLPYEPGEAERLLIHYYSALNYLQLGDTQGAAVEARRLSALLERLEAPRDSVFAGWLRYFSGTVFEAAGEYNDAGVAYRNARALLGPDAVPASQGLASGNGLGEVLVLVEEGFVAHRVEQSLVVPLYSFEVDRLTGGETSKRLAAATAIAVRVMAQALSDHGHFYHDSRPRPIRVPPLPRAVALRECADTTWNGSSARGSGEARRADCNLKNPYLLRIAWPVFRQERVSNHGLRVLTAGIGSEVRAARPAAEVGEAPLVTDPDEFSTPASLQLGAELSRAVARDFETERSAILARTILRGVTKLAVTRSIEQAPGEGAEGLGRVLGALANLSTALLEQADTRSWQLLPDRIRLVRLQLPPGDHEVVVELTGARGGARRVTLGRVRVNAGELSFLSGRVWW